MFILQDENLSYISGSFVSGKGKKIRITPEFSNDIEKAIKFEDDASVYEYFDSESRGKQVLKSYTKKEI